MLLLINTSTTSASIALTKEGKVLFTEENPLPQDHAAWLHPAVERMLVKGEITAGQLEAISVVVGPGSYTGLRVGMAAAKGFCFALNIPLIGVNCLLLMAEAMVPLAKEKNALICPMIDARRQEVFTAVYGADMKEIMAPAAVILDKTSFENYLQGNRMIFSGSGAAKWEKLTNSVNAEFFTQNNVNESFARISYRSFLGKKWLDLAYSEPIYLKEFYTHSKN